MDIALAHAYLLFEDPVERAVMKPYPPLGLLYISAYLKQKGFSVGVFDATFHRRGDFEAFLEAERPAVVGIYVNMMTRLYALEMMTAARKAGAKVILGGPEPVHHAAPFLAHGADVVVVGEGEEALEQLLPRIAKEGVHRLHDIPGIVFLDERGVVTRTPPRARIHDINTLPWPDRDAIDLPQYLSTWKTHHGKSSISLITARGCPFTCTWCSHTVYGHTHRRRKPEDVVAEILHLRERYKPDQLWVADDVFTVSRAWSVRWAGLMKEAGVAIPYECISRGDKFSEELADCLKDTGCYRVWFGSESGNQEMLDLMSRGVTLDEIRQATRWAQSRGLAVGLFVMVGFYDETPAQVEDTINHLKITRPDDFLITVAYPIKGTTYHQQLGDRVLEPLDWTHTNDRHARFKGRPSDRYMRFATSRVIHEIAAHKAWTQDNRPLAAARHKAQARFAKLGMTLARARGGFAAGADGQPG